MHQERGFETMPHLPIAPPIATKENAKVLNQYLVVPAEQTPNRRGYGQGPTSSAGLQEVARQN